MHQGQTFICILLISKISTLFIFAQKRLQLKKSKGGEFPITSLLLLLSRVVTKIKEFAQKRALFQQGFGFFPTNAMKFE
jgi:hypothetical protein